MPGMDSAASAEKRALAIMVLGTSSHAGKSTVAAALCRSLARQGYRVAPFKAQNMSNNSWVTPEGAEIGRAQAAQARAAGIQPHVDMNPILLKPSGQGQMQVMALGRPRGLMDAKAYYARGEEMRALAHAAYDRLAARFDVVVLEGAGSPAEINLRAEDFTNMAMAEYAEARCLLVADIERGGVFASILGTLELMPRPERARMAGVLINKFRGDASLLDPGIAEIAARTSVPVLGVLPWLTGSGLEEEDSLGLPAAGSPINPRQLDFAVIRVPHISNFTDFEPLSRMPGTALRYVSVPEELGNPDLILLPGSKNTRSDLHSLRLSGMEHCLLANAARRVPIFGICGGYQMLGQEIEDPDGVEGEPGRTEGLGLLPVTTRMGREKETARVEAVNESLPFLDPGTPITGYAIHMGITAVSEQSRAAVRILIRNGEPIRSPDGCVDPILPIWGCYLHGIFESSAVRASLCAWLSARRGLGPVAQSGQALGAEAVSAVDPLEALANWLESGCDPVSLLGDP